MNPNLNISFTKESNTDNDSWLHLVQEILPEVNQYASLDDIFAMIAMAQSGNKWT